MVAHSRVGLEDNKSLPTLFIDRDGVLIYDRHYLADPDAVEIIPGVGAALQAAKLAGFRLIGISNQSGIGRGFFSIEDFQAVMQRMDHLLAAQGVTLDGFYYCPHGPDDHCNCRKPLPGLLDEAGLDFIWDSDTSWVVGDKLSDVMLGRNNGLGGILVGTGHGQEDKTKVQLEYKNDDRVHFSPDLPGAINLILNLDNLEDDS